MAARARPWPVAIFATEPIDENLMRSDLSQVERSDHVDKRADIYEQLHPETRNGAAGKYRPKERIARSQLGKPCEAEPADRFTKDAGAKTGRSERSIQIDRARAKGIPQIARIARTSLDKGEELDALTKLPEDRREELIQRAKAGEKVSAKTEVKKVAREEKEKALAEKTAKASKALGTKLYSVIYADPPWRFEPRSRETGMDRAADNHYQTMSTAAICAMKIPAADDSALFLWATVPMFPDALRVMEAWGFAYRSQIVWGKDRIGTGYWTRNQHEILLIGTRGNVPAPAPGEQPRSLIIAPVGRHSVKPVVFAETIERMFPHADKLEMFARGPRAGWDTWGNEVPVARAAA